MQKQVIFTLDDGYLDNYTHAYKIFKKHNVPFTIYITASFPERQAVLWWYILEEIILNNRIVELSSGKFDCGSLESKNKVFLQIREMIISLDGINFMEDLNKMFYKYPIDWYKQCEEKCMSWEQILELSKDNLVTIGGHTLNHLALNKLPKENIISEIVEANLIIEKMIGKKVNHFGYPLGSRREIGLREFEIVKSLNMKTCTTTRRGNIYYKHLNYLYALPRIMLTENFDLSEITRIRKNRIVEV